MKDNLVIIPTYNEKENIETMIRKVMGLSFQTEVLVIEDGSPDGTGDIVRKLQTEFPEVLHMIERSGKLGLGTAYITGFKWALEKGYQFIFEMDADFSHNPEDLVRLREGCDKEGVGMSVGSRYVKGGSVKNWPWNRVLMSYFASVYVNMVLWTGIRDCTAGFVCYKNETLTKLDLDNIKFVGYAFQIEMKYSVKKLGYKITEVPITFIDRELGVSKMNMGIFKEAIFGVLKMRFK